MQDERMKVIKRLLNELRFIIVEFSLNVPTLEHLYTCINHAKIPIESY
jgi:hypothetical protein